MLFPKYCTISGTIIDTVLLIRNSGIKERYHKQKTHSKGVEANVLDMFYIQIKYFFTYVCFGENLDWELIKPTLLQSHAAILISKRVESTLLLRMRFLASNET